VHAFDILGDPVRRRILELLADGEQAAGSLGSVVHAEFGISQPAVSQHLRVLRENGFVTVRAEGTRRLYSVDAEPLREVDQWLDRYRRLWTQRLDALATELARGRRQRHTTGPTGPIQSSPTGSTEPSQGTRPPDDTRGSHTP
jgi:DNA-binding transcriptional ArsR family regulator